MSFEDVSCHPLGLPRHEPAAELAGRVPIEMLASEYLDALRVGRNPTIDEFVARFPEHADELRNLLPLVAAMEEWKADKQGMMPSNQLPQTLDIQRLGDCRIVREIGRGGMGVVFEAIQESLGRRVAVKLLPWRFGKDELWRERFQREARLAASLRHANIVPVFRFGEYEGFCYYVMPFIVGMGLDWVINRLRQEDASVDAREIERARLGTGLPEDVGESDTTGSPERQLSVGSWKKMAKIGVQAAAALRYAHSQGLLHRDIKPGNLLLDTSGTVWITDFGLAQPIEQFTQSATGFELTPSTANTPLSTRQPASREQTAMAVPSVAGTLRYMPPEQLEGRADERSDIFSLGLTLFELVTLQPAYEARSRSELIRAIREGSSGACGKRLRELAPEVPRPLADIISKACATDPANRYQSADALTSALLAYVNRTPNPSDRGGWIARLLGRR